MRAFLGLVGANAIFLACGWSLLLALQLIERRPIDLLRSAGLALLAGLGGLCSILILLLCAAVPVTIVTTLIVAIVWVAVALAVPVVRRRRAAGAGDRSTSLPDQSDPLRAPVRRGPERYLTWALGIGIGLFFLSALIQSRHVGLGFDAAHIWVFKGIALFDFSSLPRELLANPALGEASQGYPILQPVFESVLMRVAGEAQTHLVPAELWLLLAAFASSIPFLLGRRARPILYLGPLIVVLPFNGGDILVSDADVTIGLFAGVASLCLAQWLSGEGRGRLVLGALFLTAAANTKDEGYAVAIALLVLTLLIVLVGRDWLRVRWWPVMAGIVLVGALPWKIWVSHNIPYHATPTPPLSTMLNPSYLFHRTSQLPVGVEAIISTITNTDQFMLLAPGLIALAGVCLFTRAERSLAAFYLGATVLIFAALALVYWSSNQTDLTSYIAGNVSRSVSDLMFVAAVGLAHLMTRVAGPAFEAGAP
jgi:hypothetical protein